LCIVVSLCCAAWRSFFASPDCEKDTPDCVSINNVTTAILNILLLFILASIRVNNGSKRSIYRPAEGAYYTKPDAFSTKPEFYVKFYVVMEELFL
jgi:hypothetical protein